MPVAGGWPLMGLGGEAGDGSCCGLPPLLAAPAADAFSAATLAAAESAAQRTCETAQQTLAAATTSVLGQHL